MYLFKCAFTCIILDKNIFANKFYYFFSYFKNIFYFEYEIFIFKKTLRQWNRYIKLFLTIIIGMVVIHIWIT
jgi:hypothetical protein